MPSIILFSKWIGGMPVNEMQKKNFLSFQMKMQYFLNEILD